MTKKAARRGNAMSLKDFYENAPGKAPFEACLPSKPAGTTWEANAVAVTEYPRKFAPPQRELFKQQPSAYKADNSPAQHNFGGLSRGNGIGYIKATYEPSDSSYNRQDSAYPHPPARGHSYQYPQDSYRSHNDQFSLRAEDEQYQPPQQYSQFQPPPPPPPRRSVPSERLSTPPAALALPFQPQSISTEGAKLAPEQPQLTQALSRAASLTANALPKEALTGAREENDAPSDAALPPPPGLSAAPLEVELQLCSSAPKNDWAEKMARSALQRMAHAKSSLLADDVSVTAAAGLAQQVSDTADEAPATFIKPAHPFDRPRLNLKPRSQPLEIGVKEPQAAQESDLEAHRRRLQLQPRSLPLPAAMPAKEADHRPRRLQLQARTKPLADTEANKDSTACKGASIFGAARPREEVLKQRGGGTHSPVVDRLSVMAHAPLQSLLVSSRPSSRAASITSNVSEEDAWHTVSSKKASAKQGGAAALAPTEVYSTSEDVFFSTSRLGSSSFHRMGVHTFENESGLRGVYGSPYGHGSAGLAGEQGGHEDDAPVFRRSLPVRAGQVF